MGKPNTARKDDLHSDGTESVTASDARNRMGDLIDRALSGRRTAITRHGKKIAALVSARDLEKLDGAA